MLSCQPTAGVRMLLALKETATKNGVDCFTTTACKWVALMLITDFLKFQNGSCLFSCGQSQFPDTVERSLLGAYYVISYFMLLSSNKWSSFDCKFSMLFLRLISLQKHNLPWLLAGPAWVFWGIEMLAFRIYYLSMSHPDSCSGILWYPTNNVRTHCRYCKLDPKFHECPSMLHMPKFQLECN